MAAKIHFDTLGAGQDSRSAVVINTISSHPTLNNSSQERFLDNVSLVSVLVLPAIDSAATLFIYCEP